MSFGFDLWEIQRQLLIVFHSNGFEQFLLLLRFCIDFMALEGAQISFFSCFALKLKICQISYHLIDAF